MGGGGRIQVSRISNFRRPGFAGGNGFDNGAVGRNVPELLGQQIGRFLKQVTAFLKKKICNVLVQRTVFVPKRQIFGHPAGYPVTDGLFLEAAVRNEIGGFQIGKRPQFQLGGAAPK